MSKVLVLPGDGIGPEIVAEAVKVLDVVKSKFSLDIELTEGLLGGADGYQHPIMLWDNYMRLRHRHQYRRKPLS